MNKLLTIVGANKGFQVILMASFIVIVTIIYINNSQYNNVSNPLPNSQTCHFVDGECYVASNGDLIQASLLSPLRIEEEIHVEFHFPAGVTPEMAWVEGVNMYMGKIPLFLTSSTDNSYTGWFMLGFCSEPKMQWRLMLKLNNRPQPVEFLFATDMAAN
jgi:hypothetical protein